MAESEYNHFIPFHEPVEDSNILLVFLDLLVGWLEKTVSPQIGVFFMVMNLMGPEKSVKENHQKKTNPRNITHYLSFNWGAILERFLKFQLKLKLLHSFNEIFGLLMGLKVITSVTHFSGHL